MAKKRRQTSKGEQAAAEEVMELIPDEVIGKASAAAAVAVQEMFQYGDGIEIPENMSDWINLYVKHVWAYAGIYAIANTAAQLDRKLEKRTLKTGEMEDIPTHSILDLLRHPNDAMTGYDLIEALFIYLETVGNGYWEIVYGERVTEVGKQTVDRSSAFPTELWTIQPDRMKPVPDKGGKGIEKWIYQVKPHTRKKEFKPEEIVPFRYFSPASEFYGMGSIQPAVDDVRQDKQMAKWNLDFFQHGITPEGLLYTDKMMTRKELKDLGEQIKSFLSGKSRKVLILSKNLRWEQVSVNPKDVEFLAGRKENRQAILAALGVPPVKVGLLEHAKYDNYALQLQAFYKDTLLPKLKKVESALNNFLLVRFSDLVKTKDHEFIISFDTTDLLKEDEDSIVKRCAVEIVHGMMTPNEARKIRGREDWPEATGGDLFYMNKSIVPVTGGEEEETEETLEMREDEIYRKVEDVEDSVMTALKNMGEEMEQKLWADIQRKIEDELGNQTGKQ